MTCKKQKGEIDQTLKSNDYENINDFITFEESRINVFMKKIKVGHIEGLKTHCQIRKIVRQHGEKHRVLAHSNSS
jgi:hypothetical protein